MKYKLTLSEKKLPGFEAVEFTILPAQQAIHDSHVQNGDILYSTLTVDDSDPNIVHKEIMYKSKAIADSIFAEVQALGILLSRPEGIEVFNIIGEEVPE